jgi:hypothetical protein
MAAPTYVRSRGALLFVPAGRLRHGCCGGVGCCSGHGAHGADNILHRRLRPQRFAALLTGLAADRAVFKAGGLGAPPIIAPAPAPGADAPWMGGSSDRYGQGVRLHPLSCPYHQ